MAAGRKGWGAVGKEGIKSGSVAESTARHIEDLILEGSLRPGDPLLPEREMAVRLDVSRPTLRQGIKMLEDKGLLVAEPGGGADGRAARHQRHRPTDRADGLARRGHRRLSRAARDARGHGRVPRGEPRERRRPRHAPALHGAHRRAPTPRPTRRTRPTPTSTCTSRSMRRATTSCCSRSCARCRGCCATGVFHSRAKLYARPEVREVLLEQHRAIFEAVMARDPDRWPAAPPRST